MTQAHSHPLPPPRCLSQDVGEEMDPILEPVLSKSYVKRGNSAVIKLGDKEVGR